MNRINSESDEITQIAEREKGDELKEKKNDLVCTKKKCSSKTSAMEHNNQ